MINSSRLLSIMIDVRQELFIQSCKIFSRVFAFGCCCFVLDNFHAPSISPMLSDLRCNFSLYSANLILLHNIRIPPTADITNHVEIAPHVSQAVLMYMSICSLVSSTLPKRLSALTSLAAMHFHHCQLFSIADRTLAYFPSLPQ